MSSLSFPLLDMYNYRNIFKTLLIRMGNLSLMNNHLEIGELGPFGAYPEREREIILACWKSKGLAPKNCYSKRRKRPPAMDS
jgi:hypothetical protein